ncbi:galactosylceramide sulfotransferase-like [Strongylocentrotus purpuratus]|uniref:Galactosylceramide sulfotransferase-like n=1 Tax=Strongylocentrotus purpuratus TaxID=7668 RepID=A0A7M7GI87_STRPU|nr:galactosylceramide sulfotransferase-like [Strongylocentrotus purpuratus]
MPGEDQSNVYHESINNGSHLTLSDSQLGAAFKPEPLCERQKNLAFIKTHKTGSTTVASIMHRYALSHRLSCVGYKSDPARGHIRFDMLNKRSNRKFIPPLGVGVGDYANYKGYNMLTVHVRYQPKILKLFMAEGTKYVTILREPSSHFESAFTFFGAEKSLFRTRHSDNIAKFANQPSHYWHKLPRGHKKYYTRNGQMFDLSLDRRIHTDISVVKSIINDISTKFSLVLVMEYMDESLLLLKKLMCWDYRDISYVIKNHRTHTSEMDDDVRASLRKWNWADTLLYEHFNATLWKKITEYGPTFNEDLAEFREVLQKDYDECVAEELTKRRRKVVKTKLANNSDYCTHLAGSTYRLFNKVYKRQMNNTQNN